ncbi:hypothetical protein Tcan_02724 [Toxocara canis]|uniref:Uncharacterized protein n=1 Tax=Toxocara canis TaxID=6265 RepID=A0A0B2USV1_TOXCA|nr:hypothetical protein Tcan_02724 [Toxocara canis]
MQLSYQFCLWKYYLGLLMRSWKGASTNRSVECWFRVRQQVFRNLFVIDIQRRYKSASSH